MDLRTLAGGLERDRRLRRRDLGRDRSGGEGRREPRPRSDRVGRKRLPPAVPDPLDRADHRLEDPRRPRDPDPQARGGRDRYARDPRRYRRARSGGGRPAPTPSLPRRRRRPDGDLRDALPLAGLDRLRPRRYRGGRRRTAPTRADPREDAASNDDLHAAREYRCWAAEARKSDTHGPDKELLLAGGSGSRRYAYVYATRPWNDSRGVTVISATLDLFVSRVSPAPIVPLELRSVIGSWNEKSLSWAARPTVDSTLVATGSVPASSPVATKISIDVTALFQTIASGAPYFGVEISVAVAAGRSDRSASSRSEAANVDRRPVVTVVWSSAPDAPADLRPGAGPSSPRGSLSSPGASATSATPPPTRPPTASSSTTSTPSPRPTSTPDRSPPASPRSTSPRPPTPASRQTARSATGGRGSGTTPAPSPRSRIRSRSATRLWEWSRSRRRPRRRRTLGRRSPGPSRRRRRRPVSPRSSRRRIE